MGDESLKPFNIHQPIDSALLMLKNKFKNRISVQCNYDKNLPKINCNPGKLIQVFINIINNSIDSIEESGEIMISTKSEINNTSNEVRKKELNAQALPWMKQSYMVG